MINKESHHLRCDFTEPELKEFSQSLAREIQGLARAEEEEKLANSQFAERIETHRTHSSQLARNINLGYEMRLVECAIEMDRPKRGWVRIVRLDTGEVVKERLMTPMEKQMELPIEQKAEGATV